MPAPGALAGAASVPTYATVLNFNGAVLPPPPHPLHLEIPPPLWQRDFSAGSRHLHMKTCQVNFLLVTAPL